MPLAAMSALSDDTRPRALRAPEPARGRMSVRNKTLVITALTMLSAIALLYVTSSVIVGRSFARVEEDMNFVRPGRNFIMLSENRLK